MKLDDQKAIVLFSGGQDSATCLAWALAHFEHVETVGFDYGQRHRVELTQREIVREEISKQFPKWAPHLGEDTLLDARVLDALGGTAMTREMEITMTEAGLPSTFVPGRNLLFFTLAGALAYRKGARHIISGVCETDFSGYPDCRNQTVEAMGRALALGMDADFKMDVPLMWLSKAETWGMAEELGGHGLVDLILEHTHTCYLGTRETRHPWGYGCGSCPACELRAAGYNDYAKVSAQ